MDRDTLILVITLVLGSQVIAELVRQWWNRRKTQAEGHAAEADAYESFTATINGLSRRIGALEKRAQYLYQRDIAWVRYNADVEAAFLRRDTELPKRPKILQKPLDMDFEIAQK